MNHLVKSVFLFMLLCYSTTIITQPKNSVEIIKLSDKYYRIVCANGSVSPNCFASVGEDGILLIDAGFTQTLLK